MGKFPIRIEIYFALKDGLQPKDLIKRGIPPATVYAYSSRFKRRKYMEKYRELIGAKPNE